MGVLKTFLPFRWFDIAIFIVILGGCAAPDPPRKEHIFWPLPPQRPQLEFVGIYRTEKDLLTEDEKKSFLEQIYAHTFKFSFKSPFGIVADGQGRVYISDLVDKNIRVFDFNKRTIENFGKAELLRPMGLGLDEKGRLYVADGDLKGVLVFSPEGELLFKIGNAEILKNPSCLAIDKKLNRIYVADGSLHRIVAFDLTGQLLFSFGGPGVDRGEFGVPQGMCIAPDGRLFVADMLNARIQVFDSEGRFLYTFGTQGIEATYFENPKSLALSSDGILYILDHRKGLLLAYTPEGEFLFATGDKKRTDHALGFSTPTSISIDTNDVIYITDLMNRRFSVWQHLSRNYLARHPEQVEALNDFFESKRNYLRDYRKQELQ